MWNEEEMKKYLNKNLTEARYKHSLGVMNTAVKLAEKYSADINKAKIAGLIHDCAKEMHKDKLFELYELESGEADKVLRNSPALLHGAAGAFIAKNTMGVQDKEILNAIKYHTTGRVNMELLEKIIYLADYIEPARNFDGVEKLRTLAFEDLDAALILSFDNTIEVVIKRGGLIHSKTVDARNYIICNRK